MSYHRKAQILSHFGSRGGGQTLKHIIDGLARRGHANARHKICGLLPVQFVELDEIRQLFNLVLMLLVPDHAITYNQTDGGKDDGVQNHSENNDPDNHVLFHVGGWVYITIPDGQKGHQREIKGSPVLCGEVGLSDVCSSCPRFARKNVAFLRFQNGHGEECAAKYMAHQKQYYKGRYHSAVARKPVYREEAVQSDQFERNDVIANEVNSRVRIVKHHKIDWNQGKQIEFRFK
mmetsp:Transcript_26294/g.37448  ORF Transcript_26294/g.37448 Transcript_26294/m.37448 type:complete len:233 (+) Transcript_26294:832-1530(+)